ncbi:MAG TPA: hypothetical protein PLH38_04745 [Clostridia bacterium]|mgnify:CR=1 FL=1|nr:hypothetical protein [Clostridia bacterium]
MLLSNYIKNGEVVISVKYTGLGFEPKMLQRLFIPFTQRIMRSGTTVAWGWGF